MSSEQEPVTQPATPPTLQARWPLVLSWVILASSLAVGPWSAQGMTKLWSLLLHVATGIPLFKITHRFGTHALSSASTRSFWIVAISWWVAVGISIQIPATGSLLTFIGALVWSIWAGATTFHKVLPPKAPTPSVSAAPREPAPSRAVTAPPAVKAPSHPSEPAPTIITSLSTQRWPITLSMACIALSLGIRFLWVGQPEVLAPSDVRSSVVNVAAQIGWAATVVVQTFGEVLLFFVTRRFGRRALATGSARAARGVALAWLVTAVFFFQIQPETGLALAPAALAWIGIAVTIRPGAAQAAPGASSDDAGV